MKMHACHTCCAVEGAHEHMSNGREHAQVCQAVLVPLLVNKEKIGPSSLKAIKSMMLMEPPLNFKVTLASLLTSQDAPSITGQAALTRKGQHPVPVCIWFCCVCSDATPWSVYIMLATNVVPFLPITLDLRPYDLCFLRLLWKTFMLPMPQSCTSQLCCRLHTCSVLALPVLPTKLSLKLASSDFDKGSLT